jgi:hypothetical protein
MERRFDADSVSAWEINNAIFRIRSRSNIHLVKSLLGFKPANVIQLKDKKRKKTPA